MKLPERLARKNGRGFHSAIATSFAIEFGAFEEVMLPQLSIGGATNVLLIADSRMATLALSDGSALPEALGREYVLHSPLVTRGVFHPKIILQVGREGGRCIISSANITGAGLGGNVEVAVEVECGTVSSPEREIVQSAWRYLDAMVPRDTGAAWESITWARERARWLDEPGNGVELQLLADDTALAFLAAPGVSGIGARFVALVGGDAVERLVVVSPYWDEDLKAIAALESALEPAQTSLLLDINRHEFPTNAPMPAHRRIINISGWRPSRFTHAKVVIAVTAAHDHVLSGSANCTLAALGDESFAGTNAEACIYRRLPRGAATAALGLDEWLMAEPFPFDALPGPVATQEIPLTEMQVGEPGYFDAEGGRLNWTKPSDRWNQGSVVLTNTSSEVLVEIEVAKFSLDGQRLTAWVGDSILAEAAFALVRSGDVESLRSHVAHRTALRARRRESAHGSVANALSKFNDASEMQLRIFQAFDELARADVEDDDHAGHSHHREMRPQATAAQATSEICYLTYEEFMSARATKKGRGGRSDSTVSGTHLDSVRALLNRLSGFDNSTAGASAVRDDDNSWMDVGEETGELGDAIDMPEAKPVDEACERPAPDMAAYHRAIGTYIQVLMAGDRDIVSRDVLRLRLWITLILWEARCAAAPNGMPTTIDEKGWPRLIVKLLSAFFWGKSSPVKRLVVSTAYDDMPVDFFECWSVALWALDAIIAAVPDQPRTRDFRRRIPTLRSHIVAALGLTTTDLEGELMMKQRQGLDADFGGRFGLETLSPPERQIIVSEALVASPSI